MFTTITMSDSDIRIRSNESRRKRFKKMSVEEGLSYDELLEKLMDFRDAKQAEWESFDQSEGVRRTSGGGGNP